MEQNLSHKTIDFVCGVARLGQTILQVVIGYRQVLPCMICGVVIHTLFYSVVLSFDSVGRSVLQTKSTIDFNKKKPTD